MVFVEVLFSIKMQKNERVATPSEFKIWLLCEEAQHDNSTSFREKHFIIKSNEFE